MVATATMTLMVVLSDDWILGAAGNDTIYGDLRGGNANYEGVNDDNCQDHSGQVMYDQGEDGCDIIQGGSGHDNIYGEGKHDELYGNNGNDNMFGGTGDDLMKGGSGSDYMEGNDGDDNMAGNGGAMNYVRQRR